MVSDEMSLGRSVEVGPLARSEAPLKARKRPAYSVVVPVYLNEPTLGLLVERLDHGRAPIGRLPGGRGFMEHHLSPHRSRLDVRDLLV